MNLNKMMRVDTTEVVRASSAMHSLERALECMEDLGFTLEETKLAARLEDERCKALYHSGLIKELFSQNDIPVKPGETITMKEGENGEIIWIQESQSPNSDWRAEVSCDMVDLFEMYKKAFFFQNYISAIPREELKDYELAYQNAQAFCAFLSRAVNG